MVILYINPTLTSNMDGNVWLRAGQGSIFASTKQLKMINDMATQTSHQPSAQCANKHQQSIIMSGAMMRVLVVALAVLATLTASAQTRFGIVAGIVVENGMPSGDEKENNHQVGYTAGAIVDFDLPAVQGLGLEAGARYTKHTYGKPSMEQYSVDVPVHVRYRLEVPVVDKVVAPFAFTGPSVSAGVSNKMPTRLSDVKMSLAWNVGAGVEMAKHVRVAATYSIQVSKTDIVQNGSLVKGKKCNCWTITAAYVF